MSVFPKSPKEIQARIKQYERDLAKEEKQGEIRDEYGKRYLLGTLYLLANDIEGAFRSFCWYEEKFPDDIGDPGQYLSWTLTLLRFDNLPKAKTKFLQTMMQNLYLIPHLLGIETPETKIPPKHNLQHHSYLDYIPKEIYDLWKEEEKIWANECYHSQEIRDIIVQYIDIRIAMQLTHYGSDEYQSLKNNLAALKNYQFHEHLH